MAKFSNSDLRYFEIAQQEAEKSDYRKYHIGTIAVYKHRIIARGHNQTKSNPIQKKYNRYRRFRTPAVVDSIHSEIDCINKIAEEVDWSKVTLYTYRISNGLPLGFGNSAPCRACRALIRNKGIKTIYYTGDGTFVMEKFQ